MTFGETPRKSEMMLKYNKWDGKGSDRFNNTGKLRVSCKNNDDEQYV